MKRRHPGDGRAWLRCVALSGVLGGALLAAVGGAWPSMGWAEVPLARAPEPAAPAPASAPAQGSIKALPAYQDAALLARAWALPAASRYKPHIEYQRNFTFCGPTSLANVLHSWGQAADQGSILD